MAINLSTMTLATPQQYLPIEEPSFVSSQGGANWITLRKYFDKSVYQLRSQLKNTNEQETISDSQRQPHCFLSKVP